MFCLHDITPIRTFALLARLVVAMPVLRWQAQDSPILKTTSVLSVYLAFMLTACVLLCWCRGVLYEIQPSRFCALCDRGQLYSPIAPPPPPARLLCVLREKPPTLSPLSAASHGAEFAGLNSVL
eukprot:g65552.t1